MFIFCILGKQRPVDDGGGSRRSRWEKPNTEPATENEPTLWRRDGCQTRRPLKESEAQLF